MPAGPLAGVRVLDVTNTFMGPYATLLLAQQGGRAEGARRQPGRDGRAGVRAQRRRGQDRGADGHRPINAALYRRSVSGEAQSVEVPMLETLAAFTALEQQGGYVCSPPRGPAGTRGPRRRTGSPTRRRTVTSAYPTEGTLRLARHPVGHSSGRPELRPAPALGEHTAEVLAELGYEASEIGRLTDAGGACTATD
jgi:crotonobetainyl-CoA:carnitine CoA-transferase CaiB-like acyl-CoA transferase